MLSGGSWTVLRTGVTGTSYTDPGLVQGIRYYYIVTAVIEPGTSAGASVAGAPSNSVNATPLPPAPPPLVTIPAIPIVTNAWITYANGDPGIVNHLLIANVAGATGYRIYRHVRGPLQLDSDPYYPNLPPAQPETAFNDMRLALGSIYYYWVTAFNSAGESDKSNMITLIPQEAPGPLTHLTATPQTEQIQLQWDADSGATRYDIVRSMFPGPLQTLTSVSAPTTSYLDTGLQAGILYTYQVTPVNATGSGTPGQAYAIPLARLTAPTGLTATGGVDKVTLTWPAYNNAIQYVLFRGTVSGHDWLQVAAVNGYVTSCVDTPVDGGLQYFYQLEAITPTGMSALSPEASAIVPLDDSIPTATAGNASATLTWTAVPNAVEYILNRSSWTGANWDNNWNNVYCQRPNKSDPFLAKQK